MKKIIVFFLLLLSFTVRATNYYFSTSTGLDSRTSLQASNPATPWATLTRLNTFFPSLLPGDSVLFKRGETFYGMIRVTKSGSLGSPIVISAYGTGAKPIISGATNLTVWVSVGGGMWECSSALLKSTLNMLTIDGAQYAMGRFPNADAANRGYLNFEGHAGNTSITDNQLTTTPIKWDGAQLVLRTVRYDLSKATITNHTGGVLTYSPTLFATPVNGFGYFIQNDVRACDQFGEWFYNPLTRKVSLQLMDGIPSDFSIKVATVDTLLNMRDIGAGLDNVNIDGLDFQYANMRAINTYSVDNGITRIRNCDFSFVGQEGLFISISDDMEIRNNTFHDINSTGILLSGGMGYKVTGNTLRRIAVFNGMMGPVNTNTGIRLIGDNSVIKNNVLDSIGYAGIRYIGNRDTIWNNFVQHYCVNLDDAGGIYSANSAGGMPGPTHSGNRIIGNIVINGGTSAIAGTNTTTGATSGIYLDDNTNNVIVDSNSVANNNLMGIFLHNTYAVQLRRNKVYNSSDQQVYAVHNTPQSKIRTMNIKYNELVASAATQFVMQMRTDTSDATMISLLGSSDSNFIARPIDDNIVFRAVVPVGGVLTGTNRNLAQWQTYSGHETHTPKFTRTITNVNQIQFVYNETAISKSVTVNPSVDVKNNSYSGSISLPAYSSLILIQTGSLITPTITWATPAAITYGTLLTSLQLNASSGGVPGSFSYTPAAGTLLNAGVQALNVVFTPTDQTTYAVVSKTVNLTVNPAPATLTFIGMTRQYTGSPLSPGVTTSPAGLGVINILIDGTSTMPTNASTYAARAGLTNNNYIATPITGTFTITPQPVTISLNNLTQTYDGTPKVVGYTTSVPGLNVSITYNGSPTAPTAVGSYAIVGHLNENNYSATDVNGTLVISTSGAAVTITNLVYVYDNTDKQATVTTNPAGLTYDITYNGGATLPHDAGSYTVQVDLNDGIHSGSATATLVIAKANPVLTWSTPAPISQGTALSGVQYNATANVPGSFSYSVPIGTVLGEGVQAVTANFVPDDTVNYNTVSISVAITVIGNPFLDYIITSNYFKNVP